MYNICDRRGCGTLGQLEMLAPKKRSFQKDGRELRALAPGVPPGPSAAHTPCGHASLRSFVGMSGLLRYCVCCTTADTKDQRDTHSHSLCC